MKKMRRALAESIFITGAACLIVGAWLILFGITTYRSIITAMRSP